MYSQSPYLPHQLTVIYIIEKALYIKLNHIMQIHSLEHGIGSLHGMFYGAVRAKAVAIVAEFRFADRLHDLLDTLLYQPVPDTRNTQRAGLAVWLRNVFTPDRFWSVSVLTSCDNKPHFLHNCFGR